MESSVRQRIVEFKQQLRPHKAALDSAFTEISGALARETEAIAAATAAGRCVVPELRYADLDAGRLTGEDAEKIRRCGAVVIRGVFSTSQATDWNTQLADYIDANHYVERAAERARANAAQDKYFSDLNAARPQIFGLYWSKPQVEARQAPQMAAVKRYLNRLWDNQGPDGPEFDPDNDYSYADRVRRREPGDGTLGLSPHMDTGSVERWIDPAFQEIYARVFDGQWRAHDGWRAAHRTRVKEFRGPAVCSMFRTFQGWTALTPQGPGDGTLQLVPSMLAIPYMLLRALRDDVPSDALCDAEPLRALGANATWHQPVLDGLGPIPQMEPGDTIWWHPDIVHAVESQHGGTGYSNVIYVGASPVCAKNAAYVESQAAAFLRGASSPDFAPEDYEVSFAGRATIDDLSALGRAQMGL